ncbi:Hypothetical protein NTJ_11972 [Nesidiocoris tenuis]|uniref:Dynein heavy chain tail domain-containing protein n=1 Tax=Nesidiocoris tenuis TaxID=355587 RepID=A0ABN7B423_9HEMI|nr:Hypothetical protein NTJ_11972 [Nesidiocoris tenuis]
MDVKCWLFFALICVDFHDIYADAGVLRTIFEKFETDVQYAISSIWNGLKTTENLSEIIVRHEFSKMESFLFGTEETSVSGDQEDCDRMESTLRRMSSEAMEFGRILGNSTLSMAPYLEDIVICDTKTPALWLQCVLRATKPIIAIVVNTRDQIVQVLADIDDLAGDLVQECAACERID